MYGFHVRLRHIYHLQIRHHAGLSLCKHISMEKSNFISLLLKVVHSRFRDLIPAQVSKEDDPELQRPDDEMIAEVSDAICLVETVQLYEEEQ